MSNHCDRIPAECGAPWLMGTCTEPAGKCPRHLTPAPDAHPGPCLGVLCPGCIAANRPLVVCDDGTAMPARTDE